MVVQPFEERRPEGVTGADGVDDIDLRGVDLDPKLSMGPERALRPQRDHDEADPPGEDLFRRPLVIDLGKQPCEVAVARLHDRAFGDHLVESIAVLVVGGDSRPYVGVEHHNVCVVLALHQLHERGRHGLQDQAERPQMNG